MHVVGVELEYVGELGVEQELAELVTRDIVSGVLEARKGPALRHNADEAEKCQLPDIALHRNANQNADVRILRRNDLVARGFRQVAPLDGTFLPVVFVEPLCGKMQSLRIGH